MLSDAPGLAAPCVACDADAPPNVIDLRQNVEAGYRRLVAEIRRNAAPQPPEPNTPEAPSHGSLVLISTAPILADMECVIRRSGEEVARTRLTSPVWRHALGPGKYEAAIVGSSATRLFTVPERTDVVDVPLDWRPWERTALVAGTAGEGLPRGHRWAATSVGAALAACGFRLVVGAWPGVDEIVTQSYLRRLVAHKPEPHGMLTQVVGPGRRATVGTESVLHAQTDDLEYDLAIERADFVVTIGGQAGTREVVRRASARGKPVVAVDIVDGTTSGATQSTGPGESLMPASEQDAWELAIALVSDLSRLHFDDTSSTTPGLPDDYDPRRLPRDWASDPNKDRFGGSPAANGRVITAEIEPADAPTHARSWVRFRIGSTDKSRALEGHVWIYLHPTFGEGALYRLMPKDGVVRGTVRADGAFTIGVVADGGRTRLELDLEDVDGAARSFYDADRTPRRRRGIKRAAGKPKSASRKKRK